MLLILESNRFWYFSLGRFYIFLGICNIRSLIKDESYHVHSPLECCLRLIWSTAYINTFWGVGWNSEGLFSVLSGMNHSTFCPLLVGKCGFREEVADGGGVVFLVGVWGHLWVWSLGNFPTTRYLWGLLSQLEEQILVRFHILQDRNEAKKVLGNWSKR